MKYFPLFLELQDRLVLIVGDGPETAAKVEQLLQTGARVRFVGESDLGTPAAAEDARKLQIHRREFRPSDLDDVWLVVGTSEDEQLNQHIVKEAEQRRIFYNIVDVTHLCAFIYPAIISRNDVHIAISTSGKSPALAQRLKREIANLIGPEYGVLNDLLGSLRRKILEHIRDREKRVRLFHDLASTKYLNLIRQGRSSEAEHKMNELVEEAISEPHPAD